MLLVGSSELARILGATPQAINKASVTGRLSVADIGPHGKLFDVEQAKKEWEATKDVAALQNRASHMPEGMRGGRPPRGGQQVPADAYDQEGDDSPKVLTDTEKYMRARAANEALKAKERDIAIKVRMGDLVEKEQARRDGAELGAVLLGALQAWPSRLAPELASMREADEHAFHEKLRHECNELIIAVRAQLRLE